MAVSAVKKARTGLITENNLLQTLHFTHAVSKNIFDHTYVVSVHVLLTIVATW